MQLYAVNFIPLLSSLYMFSLVLVDFVCRFCCTKGLR